MITQYHNFLMSFSSTVAWRNFYRYKRKKVSITDDHSVSVTNFILGQTNSMGELLSCWGHFTTILTVPWPVYDYSKFLYQSHFDVIQTCRWLILVAILRKICVFKNNSWFKFSCTWGMSQILPCNQFSGWSDFTVSAKSALNRLIATVTNFCHICYITEFWHLS